MVALQGVNSTSVRASLAPLGICWYSIYIFNHIQSYMVWFLTLPRGNTPTNLTFGSQSKITTWKTAVAVRQFPSTLALKTAVSSCLKKWYEFLCFPGTGLFHFHGAFFQLRVGMMCMIDEIRSAPRKKLGKKLISIWFYQTFFP